MKDIALKTLAAMLVLSFLNLYIAGCINSSNTNLNNKSNNLATSENTENYKITIFDNNNYVYMRNNVTYSREGITTFANGPLRFIDAENNETIILCDDSSCLHEPLSAKNPNPSCSAQIKNLQAAALYRGSQVLICTADDSPHDIEIYTAGFYGGNRKQITRIDDLGENITRAEIQNDMLILSYTRKYDITDSGMLEELEVPIAGVILVDINTEKITLLPQHRSYGAEINHFYYKDNFIYYAYCKYTTPMNFEIYSELYANAWENEEWEPYLKYMQDLIVSSLYRYDVNTNEIIRIWHCEGINHICGFTDSYALAAPNGRNNALYMISLDDGVQTVIEELPDNNYILAYTNYNNLLYVTGMYDDSSAGTQWYMYEFTSQQPVSLFEDKVLKIGVLELFPDILYFFSTDENDDFFYGYLELSNFLSGNYDAYRILLYPNKHWERGK